MNISTRQLQAFLAVARLGSFTRAAEQIHMTQAGLSLMLRNLEEQLNCRLFNRTTRAVWLTDAGVKFQPVVERMVHELTATAEQVGRLEASARGTIIVGATPLVCATILPRVYCELLTKHPHIRVIAKDAERSLIHEMVESGEVDLGLGVLMRPASGLEHRSLFKTTLVCVQADQVCPRHYAVGRDTPLREMGKLPWSKVKSLPLISLPAENTIQQLVDQHLKNVDRTDRSGPVFNNLHSIIGMAEAGIGAAILPSFIRRACQTLAVRLDVMVRPRVTMDLYATTRRGTRPTEAMEPFINCFVECMNVEAAA